MAIGYRLPAGGLPSAAKALLTLSLIHILASAYNVQMDNLGAAYAVLTANGVATAESGTYLKSMLKELGDSGTQVAAVLKQQTGKSFADLMSGGASLGDVLQILGDSVGGNTTAFNELWSSTEAGTGALSILGSGADNFNAVLGSMQNSAGATAAAYDKMANTTEHAQKRMTNAFDKMCIRDRVGTWSRYTPRRKKARRVPNASGSTPRHKTALTGSYHF